MAKARDAFRTISEVSAWLDTPAHVLRFWESKFSQIKPVKRAGGRRYYRPDDMALLAGIKCLLHEQGLTIKGAQKLLREKGVKHVAAMSPPIDDDAGDALEPKAVDVTPEVSQPEAVAAAPPPQVTAPAIPQPDAAAPIPTHTSVTAMPPPTTVLMGVPQADSEIETPTAAPSDDETEAVRQGILGLVLGADGAGLRDQASRIVPLIERLETLRYRMRQG